MSGYIGTQPVPQSTQTRDSFTATSGQTSFATGGYQSGYIDLYLNGIKLAAADYTSTNNSDVVLAVGATAGDILEVVAYTAFNTANVTGAVDFTVTNNIVVGGTVDGRDVAADGVLATNALPKSGGAMTGAITTNSTFDGRDVAADGVLATNALPKAGGTVTGDVTFNTQIGLGAAPHATAPLNITTTNQHIRLNNGSELGAIALLSSGELELWGHGDNESINFRTGSGSGNIAMNIVGTKVGIGTEAPARQLSISSTDTTSNISLHNSTSGVTSTDGFLMQINGTTTYLWNYEAGDMVFATNNSVPMRLTSAGILEKNGNSASARIIPQSDNAGYLGEGSHRWQAVYAVAGTIQTSDQRQKTDIQNSSLGLDFIKALRPVSYKWISGGKDITYAEDDLVQKSPIATDVSGVRNHYGLLAQEVKTVLGDTDFGGWVLEDTDDADSAQSLRYDQFVAPLIKAVQEQQTIIEALTARITALEA